jgi:hypothetical protein
MFLGFAVYLFHIIFLFIIARSMKVIENTENNKNNKENNNNNVHYSNIKGTITPL